MAGGRFAPRLLERLDESMTETLDRESMPEIIGPHPLETEGGGGHYVGTVFPFDMVILSGPGVHALQKMEYINRINTQRAESGLAPLTSEQVLNKVNNSVDLIIRGGGVFIRPHPDQMFLTFMADEILQKVVPKHRIKFLYLNNETIRRAIEVRGECWRINHPPKSFFEERRMIRESKIAIHGRPIYYYNMKTGTRFLTFDEFCGLSQLPPGEMLAHMKEIREHADRRNSRLHPELALFQADRRTLSADDFKSADFGDDHQQARAAHTALLERFRNAVPEAYRRDSHDSTDWRNAMVQALSGAGDEEVSEAKILGLSSEYFMKIQWLPGARVETGGLLFDSVYEECGPPSGDPAIKDLCRSGSTVKEFIFNAFRNSPELESINVGRVEESLSGRADIQGFRGVYILAVGFRGTRENSVKIIRMQKRDVSQFLDEGADIGEAMLRAADYTNYILDRRLACRQLGLDVLPLETGKVSEIYCGLNDAYRGMRIWSTYFERDYIYGRSTEKTPQECFHDPAYAARFARLLGESAAKNIVVGRVGSDGRPLFDDGDEIVQENERDLPARILVGDITGSFGDFETPLPGFAEDYARPVKKRLPLVKDKRKFVEAYLLAFLEEFELIQEKYRRRRRGFDTLFSHEKYDSANRFPDRWARTLARLDATSPRELLRSIRERIQI